MGGARDFQRIELAVHVASSRTTAGSPTTSRCAGRPTCSRRQNGDRELVVLAAARLGRTRLIDNVEVFLK